MKAKNTHAQALALAGTSTTLFATPQSPALPPEFSNLTAKDDTVRTKAWKSAAALGPAAIKSLAGFLNHDDPETSRASKRALWKIVHSAGKPGSDALKTETVAELLPLLASSVAAARREALWMLSEIGGDECVASVARLLSDPQVREDACAALERIPGTASTAALQTALATVPEVFEPQVAKSLRRRGVKVNSYPTQNLKPAKFTSLKASS